jgi:mannitol/fructose-specific phosphotransferase system IIA component (Ntr-type)
MKLTHLISRKGILPHLKGRDRKAVVTELATALKAACPGEKIKVDEVAGAVLERELKVGSTGVGGGVAIPHARIDAVKGTVCVFGRAAAPIEFKAVDGLPVDLYFLIVSPGSHQAEYAEALKTVALAIKAKNFCKFLRAARTVKEIEEVIRDAEEMVAAQ